MSIRPRSEGEILVAASNAPDRTKFRADPFVCDGSGDEAVINAAGLASLFDGETNRYGGFRMSRGDFSIAGALIIRSRGFAALGAGNGATRIYIESGAFDTSAVQDDGPAGVGTIDAVFMLADTAEGRNACQTTVGGFWVDAFDNSGTSIYWFDHSGGGTTGSASEATYGTPTCATNGDTYHRTFNMSGRTLQHGCGYYAGSGTPTRGNNIYDWRINGITGYGYYTQRSSDNHFDQCHAITDNAAGAVGFFMSGGNTRLTGCKAAYFLDPASWGFDISGARSSLLSSEAQDNYNGVRFSGADPMFGKLRIETQENPCGVALDLFSATNVDGDVYIHTRWDNSQGTYGTFQTGIRMPTNSSSTGCGDHKLSAMIDCTSSATALGGADAITNPFVANASAITSMTTGLGGNGLAGSQSNGLYNVRIISSGTDRRVVSGAQNT